MTKKIVVILLILVVVVALSAAVMSAAGQSKTIAWQLVGTVMSISPEAGQFDVELQGSPGAATARGLSFSHPVDHDDLPPGNPCFDISAEDTNIPDGLLIDDGQIVMIFEDGSMLFGNADSDGYVCFAPEFAYAPYVLAGGTGRYEGATGNVVFEIDTHSFGPPESSPVVPETGTASGQIDLP